MQKLTLFLTTIFLSFVSLAYPAKAESWRVYKTTHFLVYYQEAQASSLMDIGARSEEYYNRIADDLGFTRFNFWLWDNRAKIYIYDNSELYQRTTGQPKWSQGVASPDYKTIQAVAGDRDFLETTLPHEIGHIIFREFVGFGNPAIPLWLDEGVASYQQKKRYVNAGAALRQAIAENKFMGLAQLFQFQLYAHNEGADEKVRLFYLEAFSLVDYLMRNFGRDNFVYFCQNLRDKKDFQRALSAAYNFSNLKELEKGWLGYLRNPW